MRLRVILACALLCSFAFAGSGRAEDPGGSITRLLHLPLPESLSFCGEPVPLNREDVAERLDLELIVTLGSPVRTTLWFKRMPRYFPAIESELRRRSLPEDLKYVALIESNLRADATSYAGAAGPWQFIRSTGSRYGLDRASWKDERRDWDEATRAALDHLADLHEHFGTWPLTLAAYNAGRMRVSQALETQGQEDFYGLDLPRETERYVFRALAAKLVVEDPQSYGIRLEGAYLYAPEDTRQVVVEVRRQGLPPAALARAAGVSYRRLVLLNPWLTGADLPRGTHRLEIPAPAAETFDDALAKWETEHPEPKRIYYRVRRGDTLSAIARRHNVGVGDLCAWNRLTPRSVIRPGQELVVRSVD